MKIYESRLNKDYRNDLINVLKNFFVSDRHKNMTQSDWHELKALLWSGNEEGYIKELSNKKYDYCLRIDFCGLSSSTLLNTNLTNHGNNELNVEINNIFRKVISEENSKVLNDNGIYLKIRFLFAYLYSEMPFSLMKAEKERNRPKISAIESANYDFNNEPGLLEREIRSSMIKRTQEDSLNCLQDLFDLNTHLEPKLHFLALNTMQVRFTPIPIPFCMLVINKKAYTDSYMYAQRHGNKQLSYEYPLIEIELDNSSNHSYNIHSHFDYIWHHDLTLIADDCTGFLQRGKGLSHILYPYNVVWNGKKKVIENYLKSKGANAKEYSSEKQKEWEINIKKRFYKTTKLPFDHERDYTVHGSIILTDFAGFTTYCKELNNGKKLLSELNKYFEEFEKICNKYNILKVKTIGDSFMCISELHLDDEGDKETIAACNAVKAAIEMLQFVNQRIQQVASKKYLKGMRVGITSGAVTLTRKQFEIDIWGDMVNLVSRLEKDSDTGKINITTDTYELIKGKFECECRGKINIEGIGYIERWFVK